MIVISENKLDFIQDEPFKAFLSLSIPIIGLLFFNELYNIFDTYFLAQLGNSVVIALGYISYIFYFINRSGKGIGRGTQSIITRALGDRDYEKANKVAVSGILIIILLSVIIQLSVLALPYALSFIKNKSSIPIIITYVNYLSIFVFPILVSEYMTEILNAEGNSKLATYIMAVGTVLNIVLDYLLICVFDMGIIGASLGTTISYMFTLLIFCYTYLVNNKHIIKINFRQYKLNFRIFKEIISNSIPIILDSFIVTLLGLMIIVFLGFLAHPIVVVAFNLMVRFEGIMSIPSQGLSRSCNIVAGHLYGAKRFNFIKKFIKKSILLSLILSIIICIVIYFSLEFFAGFFTPNKGIWGEMYVLLPWIFFDMICLSFKYNINQVLIAVGYSKFAFYSLLCNIATILPLTIILGFILNFGAYGVFGSWIIASVVQIIVSYLLLRYSLNKNL